MGRSALILAAILIVVVIAVPTASGAPWLSIGEAKRAIYNLIEPKQDVINIAGNHGGALDWNVSRCFRVATNKVQCRFSITLLLGNSKKISCYGNARAVLRGATIYSRRLNTLCDVPNV